MISPIDPKTGEVSRSRQGLLFGMLTTGAVYTVALLTYLWAFFVWQQVIDVSQFLTFGAAPGFAGAVGYGANVLANRGMDLYTPKTEDV